MGRPKKIVADNNVEKDTVTEKAVVKDSGNNIDIEAIIKQALAEQAKDFKKLLKEKDKELEEKNIELKENVKKKKEYKFIPDTTKIRLKSNIEGVFYFVNDKGRVPTFIKLNNFRDTVVVNYDELRVLVNSEKRFVQRGKIAIEEVYSESDIGKEDIIKDLRLDKVYFQENVIDPNDIEDIFTDKVSPKEFEELVKNSKDMAEAILEVAYVLYRKHQFNDNSKMNFLRQKFRNPRLFK